MTIKNIGFGSETTYHSVRYNLYLDDTDTNNVYFTNSANKKYIIPIDTDIRNLINMNRKIWITLSDKKTSEITDNDIPIIEII